MDEISLAELRSPGLQASLAKSLGITASAVSQWMSGRVPWNRCADIERATGGAATCETIRPDLRWARIPDPTWPHPAGRPCLDPAGPPTECACFEGTCRGGEVVNGKLASGQTCKRAAAESNAAAA